MDDHLWNPVLMKCHLTASILPIRLLYDHWITSHPFHYQSTANTFPVMPIKPQTVVQITLLPMIDHLTNPIQIECNLTVTMLPIGQQNPTQITLLPLNKQPSIPLPIQCHLTATLIPIKPQNSTQMTLLPMNNHSTNPKQIQCPFTVTVMPINHTMPLILLYFQCHCSSLDSWDPVSIVELHLKMFSSGACLYRGKRPRKTIWDEFQIAETNQSSVTLPLGHQSDFSTATRALASIEACDRGRQSEMNQFSAIWGKKTLNWHRFRIVRVPPWKFF